MDRQDGMDAMDQPAGNSTPRSLRYAAFRYGQRAPSTRIAYSANWS
jgi:hypothetical protein